MLDYYHRKMCRDKNSEIVMHLSHCSECRKELVFLIQAEKLLQEQASCQKFPAEIIQTAFDKLPNSEQNSPYNAVLRAIEDLRAVCKISGSAVKLSLQIL